MPDTELLLKSEPVRRLEVFTRADPFLHELAARVG